MNAARTAGVCLILVGIALAGPSFRIGTKLTWRSDAGSSGLMYDQTGEPVIMVNYDRGFVGATVEATYGPVWNVLSGRIDLYQIRVHPDDAQFEFFLLPDFGLDVMPELPVDWRVRPYVWVGARTPDYVESEPWPLEYGIGTHWYGGIGAKLKVTNRTDLFAEAQLYSSDIWRDGVSALHGGSFSSRLSGTEVTGLVGAEIGARFALGK